MAARKEQAYTCYSCWYDLTAWGVFLVLVGAWFLLEELDILPWKVSLWPIILITLGIYFLVRSYKRK